jgi:phosphate transport system substrate-binding protein
MTLLFLSIVIGIPASVIAFLLILHWENSDKNRLELDTTPGVSVNIDLSLYDPFTGSKTADLADFPEGSTLRLCPDSELPRLDGATALYPVYAAFVQAVYPHPLDFHAPDEAIPTYHSDERLIRCSTTAEAYENLIRGEADLIFVAGISEQHRQFAQERGIELSFTPIGRDAFVFFVNSENPINSLTSEQIRGIYSGKTTNWGDLGGEDSPIIAYQREQNSGSQTAMQSFMGDVSLVNPPTERYDGGMGELFDKVMSHRNHPNAIGYSFLYFTAQMVQTDRVKLLSVDGIAPNRDNIINGTYPQSGNFYAVTVTDNSENNPNIGLLIEWILSEQGQYLIEKTGYVALG